MISEQFRTLGDLLAQTRSLWAPRPFVSLSLGWERDYPAIASWARRLTLHEIETVEPDSALAPELSELAAPIRAVTRVAALSGVRHANPEHLRLGIKGRKWQQVSAFASVVAPRLEPCGATQLVEWCAGKGHLGRTLNQLSDLPATLVERDPELCRSGAKLAAAQGATCRFVVRDVLAPDRYDSLGADTAGVALHACGHLTDRLFADGKEAPLLAAAMCCFHNVPGGVHVPLSQQGRAANLPLGRPEMRLATADEVVARPRRRVMRRRDMAYRLAVDLIIRERTGVDAYTPLGPIHRTGQLALPFGTFARRYVPELPAEWDAERALKRGEERARQTRGLALIRGLYRRAVELWLVLDRAVAQEEAGRAVEVGTWCERTVTPRNLMIISTHPERQRRPVESNSTWGREHGQ